MAIKKMNRISIIGPVEEFDYVMDKYIVGTNIHIEDVTMMTKDTEGLFSFEESNPYAAKYRKITDLCQTINLTPEFLDTPQNIEKIHIDEYVGRIKKEYTEFKSLKEETETLINDNLILIKQLETMGNIDHKLENMFKLEFMRFRFGRLTKDSYIKLKTFLSDMECIFVPGKEEGRYIYGMYLTPHVKADDVDDVFRKLNFERIRISDKATGTPYEAIKKLEEEIVGFRQKLSKLLDEMNEYIENNKDVILSLYSVYKRKYDVFALRDYAVHTSESFYLVGWATHQDAADLAKRLQSDSDKVIMSEILEEVDSFNPPTVLENPKIFKPFESLIKMYALPSYNEIDPTPILAITYTIIFGMMFGDIGQGLLLSAIGWILYKVKKIDLGGVIGMVGLSAAFFGVLYGSVFGKEFHGLWINPMENTSTILITAIIVGMVLVIMSMGVNLANSIKTKNWGRLLFDHNGIAGVIFYVSAVAVAYFSMVHGMSLPLVISIFLFGIPLIVILLKQPLTNLIERKKYFFEGSKGEYLTEGFFELFEVILSYVTNTISFIRIGAFALVHAGMMLVVYTLVGMMDNFSGGIVAILGNIFVMALEAFLVGIQTLRLEFYEMFSRFFSGEGKQFEPFDIKKIK